MIKDNAFGDVINEGEPFFPLGMKIFKLEPGKAFYIGEYKGRSYCTFDNSYKWHVTSDPDNYQKTTEEFWKRYPKFDGVVTVNGMGDMGN